jgi:hypothetical protein
LYTDDSILTSPSDQELDKVIAEVQITKQHDGKFKLTQAHLIENILKDLQLFNVQ